MRLLFIRHGDPNYELDTLTPTGRIEAELLAERMMHEKITEIFVSPLGRAKATAEPTLKKLHASAAVKDWLREFPAVVDLTKDPSLAAMYPDTPKNEDGTLELRKVFWDIMPDTWTGDERYFDKEAWKETPPAKAGDLEEVFERVRGGFDELLAAHGYVRENGHYRTEEGNHETLVFFCHFGLISVLLAHLWGVSPYITPHMLALAPTSVTEVFTEERKKGEVIFRATKIGDISHLYAAGREPSFSARFCETYEDIDQRH